MSVIDDGTGTGKKAKVDSTNRLQTSAVTEPIADHAAESGVKFNINTGDITVTNATKTTMLYIKNTGSDEIVISALIYNLGTTASGSGDVKIDVIRNPTTGDIIDNTNDVEAGNGTEANQNFGSNLVLNADIYKGATGETLVNGSTSVSTRSASATGRIVVTLGSIVIPKGSSIAVNYTPPTSNTSQIVQFAAACYVRTASATGE